MEESNLARASELLQSLQEQYDNLLKRERELMSAKVQSVDQYSERRSVSKEASEIRRKIVYQTNIVQALRSGGSLTNVSDQYGNSFVCPDFRKIPAEYYAFEEDTILLNPKPDYIPDLGKEELRSKGYVFDSVRIEEDSYVIALNGFWFKKGPSKYFVSEEPEKEMENTFSILTLEQLVLTSQYYFVYAKAVEIKRAKEANDRNREYFINKPESSRLWYYDQKNFYFALPSKVKKQYTKEQWDALSLKEKEDIYVPVQRVSVKRIESKLDSNEMYRSLHRMYEAFVDSTAISPKEGIANPKVWEYWETFREMMKWKINDLQVRSESDSQVREIALETSFGDTGINSQLRDTLGIFVKRQNGTEIDIDDINQISEKWISLNNTFGVLNKTAFDFGLKISHTGKTFVYASKASGMFIASRRAIAVTNKFGDSMFGYILAHEVGHFIDYTVGKINGRRHASDNYESTAGKVAIILKKNLNKNTDSKYINSTNECFARAMEQYFAISTTGDGAFHEYGEGKLYFQADEYVSKDVYYNQLKPAVEAFLKESSWIFGDIVMADLIDVIPEIGGTVNVNKEQLNEIEDYEESSKQLPERLSQEEKQGVYRGGKRNAEATILLGTVPRTVTDNEGAVKELPKHLIKRNEEIVLKKYAQDNNIWIESDFGEPDDSGQEQDIYFNPKEGTVIKVNSLSAHETWGEMFDRIAIHNALFPDTYYELKGFTNHKGLFSVVLSQPFIQGGPVGFNVLKKHMDKLGFTLKYPKAKDNNERFTFENKNTGVIVKDLHGKNVIISKDNKIHIIDPLIEFSEDRKNKSQENEPTTDIGIPQEVEGIKTGSDSLDEATGYISNGIAASKEEQQGRLSAEEERRLEKVFALRYAKENGRWIADFYSFGTHMEGGNENTLAYNHAEGMVYKSNNLSNYGYSILKMLEGIKGHNEIFDCDKYEFVGFTGVENKNGSLYIEPVFKQKYMHQSSQASQSEIDAFMQGLGFSKTGDHSYENEKYMVADLRPRNVLKDENGNICVIDDIVKIKEEIELTWVQKAKQEAIGNGYEFTDISYNGFVYLRKPFDGFWYSDIQDKNIEQKYLLSIQLYGPEKVAQGKTSEIEILEENKRDTGNTWSTIKALSSNNLRELFDKGDEWIKEYSAPVEAVPESTKEHILFDINGVRIKEGDKVRFRASGGGILPPGEPIVGIVEKTKDAFGHDAFQLRHRMPNKNYDQLVLIDAHINEVINDDKTVESELAPYRELALNLRKEFPNDIKQASRKFIEKSRDIGLKSPLSKEAQDYFSAKYGTGPNGELLSMEKAAENFILDSAPEPEPPLQSDAEYFKNMLNAIKVAEKFADAKEKVYFRELKEAIKISLKYS